MVGILIEIGNGKKEIQDIEKIMKRCDRQVSIKLAPPEGLYLRKVWY